MQDMSIIIPSQNVSIVEKSLYMKKTDYIMREKNIKRRWRDAYTKTNTSMKTSLHHLRMR